MMTSTTIGADTDKTPIESADLDHRVRLKRLLLIFLGSLGWSVLCTAILEIPSSHTRGWWAVPLAGIAHRAGTLWLWLLLLALMLLSNRVWIAFSAVLTFSVAIAVLDGLKRSVLQQPIYPSDIEFVRNPELLLSFVPAWTIVASSVGLVGLFVAVPWLGRRWGRGTGPLLDRRAPRIVAGILALCLVGSSWWFHASWNPWSYLYTKLDATAFVPWSQNTNYFNHGFVGGFLYNTRIDPMAPPAGYSADTMTEIADRYTTPRSARSTSAAAGPSLDGANLVVVLSEGFSDLSRLSGLDMAEDSMPQTRELMGQTWSGQTVANFYGNGTASMEFEVLTGQTLGNFRPQIISPYQDFMSAMPSYPSAIGYFKSEGYKTVAIHPYKSFMYKRDKVYPMLGFDQFIDEEQMSETTTLDDTDYISDQAAFDQTIASIDDSDQPVMVNLVTMQNHGPTEGWSQPIGVDGYFNTDEKAAVGNYAAGLKVTDSALQKFLTEIRASGEPTYVVFYGDHYAPSIPSSVVADQTGHTLYQTPFLLWSSESNSHRALPVTSPAAFLPRLFEMVGAEMPPYYRLLNEAAEQLGAIGPGYITGTDGEDVDTDKLTSSQQQLLDDLRMVQYDFSVGERYAVNDMWYDFN